MARKLLHLIEYWLKQADIQTGGNSPRTPEKLSGIALQISVQCIYKSHRSCHHTLQAVPLQSNADKHLEGNQEP